MNTRSKTTLLLLVLCASILAAPSFRASSGPAPATAPLGPPLVVQACAFDVSPPLREIESESLAEPSSEEAEGAMPRRLIPGAARGAGWAKGTLDPVLQGWPGAGTMPQPLSSWEGISGDQNLKMLGYPIFPPDTNGDVGPNHYVQWVNLLLAVWDKRGNLLLGPIPGNAIWHGFGGAADKCNDGDPIAIYDRIADRWFVSQFAVCDNNYHGPFYQYVAVSATPDPTGAWYRYAFLWPNGKFNDYPKFGVWPDGYYMSSTQWGSIINYLNHWAGEGVAVLDRAKMLAGDPSATLQYFDLYGVDPNFGGMLPSHVTGPNLPPAGAPNTFVAMNHPITESDESTLSLWEFHVDWSDPTRSTYGISGAPNQVLVTAPYDSNMCNYQESCIRQPGTDTGLDAIADRVMYKLAYRNFDDHQALVVNQTVDVDGSDHAGLRWYELRSTGGDWRIEQQGTFAPDSDNRWMGGIAMDGSGDIAIGFNVSGSSTYPSIRYAGRLAGDPPGELSQGEATLAAGAGSITSYTRYGDYSAMSVDPNDDCTFWFTGEYVVKDTAGEDWHTRIGSFRFPSCGMSVSAEATPSSGNAPLSVAFAAHGSGGVTPFTYAWDFGDGSSGTGETAGHTYQTAGSFTAKVTMKDSSGGTATGKAAVLVTVHPPVISSVAKPSGAFRLKVTGENFHAGCTIKINGSAAPQTQFKSSTVVQAGGGAALKAMVPKGQTVQITVTNNDDGGVSTPFNFSW